MTKQTSTLHSILAKVGKGLLALITVAAIGAAVTPSLVSTDWGRNQLINLVNRTIPGKIQVTSLQVGWFGKQSVEGFELRDPKGDLVLSIPSMTIDAPLSGLASWRPNVKKVTIQSPRAMIVQSTTGRTNIQDALGAYPSQSPEMAQASLAAPATPAVNMPWLGVNGNPKLVLSILGELVLNDGYVSLQGPDGVPAVISNIQAHVSLPSPPGDATATLTANTARGPLAGTINLEAIAKGFNQHGELELVPDEKGVLHTTGSNVLQVKASVDQLPTEVLDRLIAIDRPHLYGLATAALGPTLTSSAVLSVTSSGTSLQVAADSEALHVKGSLGWDGAAVIINEHPLIVTWNLTQERFQSLQQGLLHKTLPIFLASPVQVITTIHSAHIPTDMDAQIAIDGQIALSTLNIQSASGGSASFQNLTASFNTENLSSAFAFTLKGTGKTSHEGAVEEGVIDFNGSVEHLISRDWTINPSAATIKVKGRAESLPIILMAEAAGYGEYREEIRALVGIRLAVELEAAITKSEGNFLVRASGNHLRSVIDAKISNGLLTLNQPFQADIEVHERLSQLVMKKVNPLLITAVSSERPVTVRIDPRGFSIPLNNFDIRGIELEQMTIDPGKVTLKNGGPLAAIISFLKSNWLQKQSTMVVWFTPQYVSMHNGIVKAARSDALIADQFHIATWGKIDVPDDRIKMTLGFTGDTLATAFGLRNIPADQMLQIKMSGSTNNPKVETMAAATRLTALIAQDKTGQAGSLIKGLLDLFPKSDASQVPAPTVTPFPWENDPEWQSKQAERETRREQEKQDQKNGSGIPSLTKTLGKEVLKIFKK